MADITVPSSEALQKAMAERNLSFGEISRYQFDELFVSGPNAKENLGAVKNYLDAREQQLGIETTVRSGTAREALISPLTESATTGTSEQYVYETRIVGFEASFPDRSDRYQSSYTAAEAAKLGEKETIRRISMARDYSNATERIEAFNCGDTISEIAAKRSMPVAATLPDAMGVSREVLNHVKQAAEAGVFDQSIGRRTSIKTLESLSEAMRGCGGVSLSGAVGPEVGQAEFGQLSPGFAHPVSGSAPSQRGRQ